MKSIYWMIVACALIACGNNRDAEFPDDEQEQDSSQEESDDSLQVASQEEDDERRVPPVGQWTEEDTARLTPPQSQPAPAAPQPAPATAPGEWKPRVAADASPTDDRGRRNFAGTAPQSGDVLFEVPMFWMVKEASAETVVLYQPQNKVRIKMLTGPSQGRTAHDVTEILRGDTIKNGTFSAGPTNTLIGPTFSGWHFKYLATDDDDERAGRVAVISYPHASGEKMVIIMGAWTLLTHAPQSMDELIRSLSLKD